MWLSSRTRTSARSPVSSRSKRAVSPKRRQAVGRSAHHHVQLGREEQLVAGLQLIDLHLLGQGDDPLGVLLQHARPRPLRRVHRARTQGGEPGRRGEPLDDGLQLADALAAPAPRTGVLEPLVLHDLDQAHQPEIGLEPGSSAGAAGLDQVHLRP